MNNILSSFEGVYTKNRNFRLYKSSKLGKNAAFCVAEDNTFLPKPPKHTTKEEYIFLASLITNIRLFVCIFTSLCKHVVHTMVEPAFLWLYLCFRILNFTNTLTHISFALVSQDRGFWLLICHRRVQLDLSVRHFRESHTALVMRITN